MGSGDASKSQFHFKLFLDSLSGICGAACLVAVGAPFDAVKLASQISGVGVFSAAAGVVRLGGLRALWRGSTPALASASIENAVVFAATGALRRVFAAGDEAELSAHASAAMGAATGVLSAVAICPAEVIKVRMQALAVHGEGGRSALTQTAALLRNEGLRGAFSGLRPLLARDVPFYFVFLGSYRAATLALASATNRPPIAHDDVPVWMALVAGGAAGAAAWATVFPFDTLKSRAQVHGGDSGIARGRVGLFSALRAVGLRGLYAGAPAAIARGAVANAALFAGQAMSMQALSALALS